MKGSINLVDTVAVPLRSLCPAEDIVYSAHFSEEGSVVRITIILLGPLTLKCWKPLVIILFFSLGSTWSIHIHFTRKHIHGLTAEFFFSESFLLCWAGEIIELVMCMPHKAQGPGIDSQNPHKKNNSGCNSLCLWSSLVYLASYRLVRDLVSNKKVMGALRNDAEVVLWSPHSCASYVPVHTLKKKHL